MEIINNINEKYCFLNINNPLDRKCYDYSFIVRKR